MGATGKLDGGFLFEGFDELCQVAFVRGASHEQMQVVRHNAVSVDEERAKAGMFMQAGDQPVSEARVCTEAAAIMEAERNEIHRAAAIPVCWKPDVLVLEFSGCGHDCASQRRRAEGRGPTLKPLATSISSQSYRWR